MNSIPKNRAPLLDTIHSLVHSDCSDSDSECDENDSKSQTRKSNENIKMRQQTKTRNLPLPHVSSISNNRSKVRFNTDVLINNTPVESHLVRSNNHTHNPNNENPMSIEPLLSSLTSTSLNSEDACIAPGEAIPSDNKPSPGIHYANLPSAIEIVAKSSIINQNNHNQFKSILKDPLCANLRNSLMINNSKNNKQQDSTTLDKEKSSSESLKGKNHQKKEPIDTDQLESEIDQLLYGPVSLSTNEQTGSNSSSNENNRMSSASLDMDPVLFAMTSNANAKVSNNSRSNRLFPYETYIHMIEDKYRNSQSHHSNSSLYTMNKWKGNSGSKSGKSNTTNGTATNNNHKSIKQTRKTNKIHRNGGSHQHNSKSGKPLKNTENMNLTHVTIDQWMATLAQESKVTLDTQHDQNIYHNTQCKIQQPQHQQRQEELYQLLSDPVKGPPINQLMDQLSGCGGDYSNDIINKSSIGFNKEINKTNNKTKKTTSGSTAICSTSSSSSCSTNNTILSRSLVENHIYEEILYE